MVSFKSEQMTPPNHIDVLSQPLPLCYFTLYVSAQAKKLVLLVWYQSQGHGPSSWSCRNTDSQTRMKLQQASMPDTHVMFMPITFHDFLKHSFRIIVNRNIIVNCNDVLVVATLNVQDGCTTRVRDHKTSPFKVLRTASLLFNLPKNMMLRPKLDAFKAWRRQMVFTIPNHPHTSLFRWYTRVSHWRLQKNILSVSLSHRREISCHWLNVVLVRCPKTCCLLS